MPMLCVAGDVDAFVNEKALSRVLRAMKGSA
jgi:hypothetical protein